MRKFLKVLFLLNFFSCLLWKSEFVILLWPWQIYLSYSKGINSPTKQPLGVQDMGKDCPLVEFVQRDKLAYRENYHRMIVTYCKEPQLILSSLVPEQGAYSLFIMNCKDELTSGRQIQYSIFSFCWFSSWLQFLVRGDYYSDIKPERSQNEMFLVFLCDNVP